MDENRPGKILISGYYGFDNAGDEAILHAMCGQIKKTLPSAEIIVLSGAPEKTSEQHGVQAHPRMDLGSIYKLLDDADVFLSGGGGLIQDSTSVQSAIYYLGLIELALRKGKKVMVYAQGLGPLNRWVSRWAARMVLNRVNVITVRDPNSMELLKSIGVKKPPTYLTADPVFSLQPAAGEALRGAMESEKIKGDNFKLGISVRPWKTEADYVRIIASVADEFARQNQAEIFIFPFKEPGDLEICRKIADLMEQPAAIVRRKYPIPVMMGLMGQMDAMVGMRLHSLIFSSAQLVPVVGISYDPKVTNLMEMLELPVIDLKSITREKLENALAELFLKREIFKKKLEGAVTILKERAEKNVVLLKELVGNKHG